MSRARLWLTMLLCCLSAGPLAAQTAKTGTDKTSSTSDTTNTIGASLRSGGLASILRDGDLARALGLNEDQFVKAQDILDAYEALMQAWAVLDPQMMQPETMRAMMTISFMLEWELYSLLDEEQQQELEKLFEQWQGQGSSTQNTKATSKAK